MHFNKKPVVAILMLSSIAAIVLFTIKYKINLSTQAMPFPNTYSDGWFEYSFRYPADATVASGSSPSFGAEVYVYRQNSNPPTCIIGLYRNQPYHDDYIDQIYDGFDPDLVIPSGKLNWRKERIASYDLFYGFKSTVWLALTPEFMFKMLALERNQEGYCQRILSSIVPTLDVENETAVKQYQIKQVALDYAKINFPDKKYLEGGFSEDGAVVLVSNSTSVNDLQENKFIHLVNTSGVWKVSRVSDYREY